MDTTIMYQGGSGGFLLYYAMLATGNYTTGLELREIAQAIQSQFPWSLREDTAKWKETERWPDNSLCKNDIAPHPRLFLFCNPTFNNVSDQYIHSITDGTQVTLLYTDLHTQLRLAYEKKAYWFTKLGEQRFRVDNQSTKSYIRSILESGVMWRGELCDPALPVIEKEYQPAAVIKLQDLITDLKYKTVTDRWLQLHSKKARRLL